VNISLSVRKLHFFIGVLLNDRNDGRRKGVSDTFPQPSAETVESATTTGQ